MGAAQPRLSSRMEQLMAQADLGEYCRRIEDHLTRMNAGHLVRIVGPGFELVRGWADAGVPLSVVYRGIDLKAERHRDGASKRPLRIEFCAGDVQAVFDQWRRAVGIMSIGSDAGGIEAGDATDVPAAGDEAPDASPKRRSLGRHLDRAIDRLSWGGSPMDGRKGFGRTAQGCCKHSPRSASLRRGCVAMPGPKSKPRWPRSTPSSRTQCAAIPPRSGWIRSAPKPRPILRHFVRACRQRRGTAR